MRDITKLLSLPAALLNLALAQCAEAQEAQWPYNLPRNAKYYPEDEPHVKRGLEAQERLQWHAPQSVKKMGDDGGEKFFFDYWDFGDQTVADDVTSLDNSALRRPVICDETGYDNDTATRRLHAPFRGQIHPQYHSPFYNLFGRSIFRRDFECPADTRSCSNVGSDLCCQSSETCVNTNDGVGCCPNGGSCGQEVAECDTGAGYSSCPDSSNGGCCLPGFQCLDVGCVFYGTSTIIATATPATVTTGTINPTTMTEQPNQGTTVIVAGQGSITTVTMTAQGTTVTATVTTATTITLGPSSTNTACSSDFFSCPASLGGGCCRNGQACATNHSCPDLTTTTFATARPPDRPTSSADISPADTTITSQPAVDTGNCPTGFYMCSAVYLGGCCRVDRNCDTTSCPASEKTAIVTSGGVTISAGATGCASAWSSCDADVGGGCCPPGFNCGTQCVAQTGGQTTAKVAASGGAVVGVGKYGWIFLGFGVVMGVGMVWL